MTTRFASTVATVGVFLLLGAAREARAYEFAIEIEPGVGIPLAPFPTNVPTYYEETVDVGGMPTLIGANYLVDLHTGVGFNGAISAMLNDFTLRVAVGVHKFPSITVTNIALVKVGDQQLPDIMQNVYLKDLLGLSDLPQSADLTESPTLTMVRVTLGYRWYLTETRLRPYIPAGIGLAIANLAGETFFGMAVHMGVGLEYRVAPFLDVGIAAQYEWMGVTVPESFSAAGAKSGAITQISSGSSVVDAFLKSLHSLQLGATFTFRFPSKKSGVATNP
jgi:hypothetical protein